MRAPQGVHEGDEGGAFAQAGVICQQQRVAPCPALAQRVYGRQLVLVQVPPTHLSQGHR